MAKFTIHYGHPTVDAVMSRLLQQLKDKTIQKNDHQILKRYVKCLGFLAENPFHPGLKSHEISTLTKKYGLKIFQSYLQNNFPSAGRVFWFYGPGKKEITICGLEPHPEPGSYERIKLDKPPP